MVGEYQPILNGSKPFIVMLMYEGPRNNYISILALVKNSGVILLCIMGYVSVASFVCYINFQSSLEGYSFFMTPAIALYETFILFTTSNFPNIMLPAYYANRWSSLYFVGFLIFGIFFLMNILLAAVIDNYKDRSVKNTKEKTSGNGKTSKSFSTTLIRRRSSSSTEWS
jgi:two pore calcium channel protein, plant